MSYKTIPFYNSQTKEWSEKVFETRVAYVEYLWTLFKVPGKYNFDSISFMFNEQSRNFNKNNTFSYTVQGSKDYVDYWDDQKKKCRNGAIFTNGTDEWIIVRDYYFLINFLKIYNKESSRFSFIDVRDTQYHMALYEEIAEHSFKHSAILKKRQMLSSYFHAAKILNRFWFEEGAVLKMAASRGDYINQKGTWKYLEVYRDFLNEHTAWYRPCNPDKLLNWEQKIEINKGGKKVDIGLKSSMVGLILDKDPAAGVGGPCLSPWESVTYANGTYKFAKDVKVGDKVVGADGLPKKVTNIFSGQSEMYKVEQSLGKTYIVTADHTLYLYNTNSKSYEKIKAKDFNNLSNNKRSYLKGIKYNENSLSTITVTPIGIGDYNGFECEDNLFVLEDGTITHNCSLLFYEEAGIAPKMNQTLEYLLPALKSGMTYTGMFVAAGSVGDLDDCEPLKELIFRPNSKDVLAIKTDLLDDKGSIGECGLFIPEQWGMPPFIDEYGNSLVEESVEAILEERKIWEKELSPEDYRLRISQKPLNIKEAFDYREESPFPQHLITAQIERILNNEYFLEYVDLKRDINGKVQIYPSRKLPISEFPLSPKTKDKEGAIVMHEKPDTDAKFGTYYASLDPVTAGRTTTSNSLASIYIYKNDVEISRTNADGIIENYIEPGKLVCWWTGRFDDIELTHARIEMMLELYNAWCVVENNITDFNTYMIGRKKQRYLVPKNQMLFLKDIGANANVFQEYGWRNTGTLFKNIILPYGINFMKEELDHDLKTDGTIVKTYYGINRIPDIMLLKEMQAYNEGLNVDRIVAYSALAAFVMVQKANKGILKTRKTDENLQKSNKNINLKMSNPFRNMGTRNKKTGFKNIR